MEIDIKRKEFEFQQRLELAKIEVGEEVVDARDSAELLEAKMARQELSALIQPDELGSETTVLPSSGLQVNKEAEKDVKRSSQKVEEDYNLYGNSKHAWKGPATVVFAQDSAAVTRQYSPSVIRATPRTTQQQDNLLSQTGDTTILSSLVKRVEKIGISYDLPAIQIQKFHGSPQDFPIFIHATI